MDLKYIYTNQLKNKELYYSENNDEKYVLRVQRTYFNSLDIDVSTSKTAEEFYFKC